MKFIAITIAWVVVMLLTFGEQTAAISRAALETVLGAVALGR